MKINRKMLSIPPHVSTSWNNVSSLHLKNTPQEKTLVITLSSGSVIEIPSLDEHTLTMIFEAHSSYIENGESSDSNESEASPTQNPTVKNPFTAGLDNTLTLGFPFKMGDMDSMSGLTGMMQHNQDQANSPNLPKEALEKITSITKALGLDKQLEQMPKAEPHCNCPYCQLARAMHGEAPQETSKETSEFLEEDVSDEDLSFREWDIKQVDAHLYDLTNPFDSSEHYQVFLGTPVGCTCGQKDCEHIKAVLKS